MELVGLALGLQFLFELADLAGRGVLVVGAEQAEQRAGQVPGQVLDGAGLQRHALRRGAGDERAVAVDGGVERQADPGQEGLAAAGAVADDADLAVGRGQAAQVRRGPGYVADQARVGHAALGAGRRGSIVGAGARGVAVIEVRHERVVAFRGETPGDLLGRRVVAGHVMDHDHAAERSGAHRPGQVGLDLVPAAAADGDGLGQRRVVHQAPLASGDGGQILQFVAEGKERRT
jgi:hypothetical protein